MPALMIYGATGFTGRLACEHAKKLGLDLVVAGRSEAKTVALAELLDCKFRHFDVADDTALDNNLASVKVLLNIAGPFSATAERFMKACIRNHVHYLDTSAELVSYEIADCMDEMARKADVMLMPGCGGSVAMFSCMASHALDMMPTRGPAEQIEVALHVSGPLSRGSTISAAQGVTNACLERRGGKVTDASSSETVRFDFQDGNGEVKCTQVTLPDVLTLWKSTRVNNIRCYVHMSSHNFTSFSTDTMPEGPTEQEREKHPYHAVLRIKVRDGATFETTLHIVNGYTFTATASVEAACLVLNGSVKAGFQTPAPIFGASFVDLVPGSQIT